MPSERCESLCRSPPGLLPGDGRSPDKPNRGFLVAKEGYPESDEKENAMKRVVVTLSVLSMVVLGTSVLAVQPDMYSYSDSGQGFIGECDAGFEVWEDVSFDVRVKDYKDKDGIWIRSKQHVTVEGKVYNYDDPTKYLPYKNSVYSIFDDPDTTRIAGLWALVTVPGEGVIFIDVGLIIFDVDGVAFEAGKHQWWNENVDALCGHLAD